MACGCASRMRTVLRLSGYTIDHSLDNPVWEKGDHKIPDAEIESDHFRILIETIERKLMGGKARAFSKRLGGH